MNKDGVAQLYPTKPGGEEWYLTDLSDPRFKPEQPSDITRNPDGSWKQRSTKVRLEVMTSSGYRTPDTYDRPTLAARGYMLAPNDWRNVEMTGFVRLNRASASDAFTWYARGGRHSAPIPCEGSSVKGNLGFDGRARVEKESWHVSYAQAPWTSATKPIIGRWVGFKVVIRNVEGGVRCDMYVSDPAEPASWKLARSWTDDGTFGGNASHCGAVPDGLPITWGGPIACFRWDNAEDVDFKLLSVREIDIGAAGPPGDVAVPPPVVVPNPPPTLPGLHPGGPVALVPTIDHFEQVAPDRIVKTTVDGREVYAFTVKPGDVQEWDKDNIAAYRTDGKPNERAEISYAAAPSADKGKSPYSVTDKTGFRAYGISFNFADGWPRDQRWATLLQFHQQDGTQWGGFGGIGIHGNTIDIGEPGSDDEKYIVRIPLVTEQWYDLRLEVNWTAGPDGYVRVFRGGALLGQYRGATIQAGTYHYIKQGYYRDPIDQSGTVYQTPLVISEDATPVVIPPPVVLPPTPPAPPAVPPVVASPVTALAPGLQLLVDELPVIDLQVEGLNAQIGALNLLLTSLQIRRTKVKALLDRGAKWNDPA